MMAKILCVDDEDHIREDICELLEGLGHTIVQANDGAAGLKAILEHDPDLVLCDFTMPNMDGGELLTELRQNHQRHADTPFIFLSALSDREDILEGIKLGADDYLTKPIDFDMLENKVEACLRQMERMKSKKDQELLRLYNALKKGEGEKDDGAGKASDEQPPTEPTAEVEAPEAGNAPEQAPPSTPAEEPEQKKIFGTIFRFTKADKYKAKLPSGSQDVQEWLEEKSLAFLKPNLSKRVFVSKIAGGGLLLCYMDGDVKSVQEESRKLFKQLESHLGTDHFDDLVRQTTVPKETLKELVEISSTDYETEVGVDCLSNPQKFLTVIQDQVDKFYFEIGLPEKLRGHVKHTGGHVVPSKLYREGNAETPISFFSYDSRSAHKILSAFALFNDKDLAAAKFQTDLLTLELLQRDLKKHSGIRAIFVDVHYETISSRATREEYEYHFRKFTKDGHAKPILNVHGLSSDIAREAFDSLFAQFGKDGARRLLQVPLRGIGAFADALLPVTGIVCAHADFEGIQPDSSEFTRAKNQFAKAGQLFILRGVPPGEEDDFIKNYGFSGYSTRPEDTV